MGDYNFLLCRYSSFHDMNSIIIGSAKQFHAHRAESSALPQAQSRSRNFKPLLALMTIHHALLTVSIINFDYSCISSSSSISKKIRRKKEKSYTCIRPHDHSVHSSVFKKGCFAARATGPTGTILLVSLSLLTWDSSQYDLFQSCAPRPGIVMKGTATQLP